MSKASGVLSTFGRFLTYILVVLLVLGFAGMVAYFVLRSQGVTYYVEYNGERYLANGDGGRLELFSGEIHDFTVKSLVGDEVNFDVVVQSNSANNFSFTYNGSFYQFYSTTDEDNDYSAVFGLQKDSDGFSLMFPDDFTVEQAVEEKFGGDVSFDDELENDKAYFVIIVLSGESTVHLWFTLNCRVAEITLDPPQIVF